MSSIVALTVAPVKALSVVRRESVLLEPGGVAEDRRLFLLRPDGSVATQRRHPSLTSVVPDLDLERRSLSVTFPDGTVVDSALMPSGEARHAVLFGKPRTGRVVPGAVADALSDHVGERLRLVLATSVGVGWDEGPVSLVSSSSIVAVGAPAAGEPGRRFRMLMEVGDTAAYEEDAWVGTDVRVGEATLTVTHRLGRCMVIDHSPTTGTQDWPGVRAIAALRGRDTVTLGVIAQVRVPGRVSLGDRVEPA